MCECQPKSIQIFWTTNSALIYTQQLSQYIIINIDILVDKINELISLKLANYFDYDNSLSQHYQYM